MNKQLFTILLCLAAMTTSAQEPVVNELLIGRGELCSPEGNVMPPPVYTHPLMTNMSSRSFRFFYKIEGDRLYLKGIDNSFKEIWVRISD